LLKETAGVFDGARTHNLLITSQTCHPLFHAARQVSDQTNTILFWFISAKIDTAWYWLVSGVSLSMILSTEWLSSQNKYKSKPVYYWQDCMKGVLVGE